MKKLYSIVLTIQFLFSCYFLFAQQPIYCGPAQTFFLCSDGTLMGCGNNNVGQLGDSAIFQTNLPFVIYSVNDVIAVASGWEHSLFLKKDGTVWASGSNSQGQLGLGNNTSTKVPIMIPTLSNVISVAAGAYFSMFLKADGTVWSCGTNSMGQLGIGSTIDQVTPMQVSLITDIKSISARSHHSLFLKSDGTVWGCGSNQYYCLGNGIQSYEPLPIPITALSDIKSVSAGGEFSLFLRGDDSVLACGHNHSGELGDGTGMHQPFPIVLPTINNVSAISTGDGHSVFLKKDSTVWTCGNNSKGQLGQGSFSNTLSPIQISSINDVKYISTGNFHTLLLKNDYTTMSFGDNSYGQLGDGSNNSSTTPTIVTLGICQPSIILDTLYYFPKVSGNCGSTLITFSGKTIKPKMQIKFNAIGQADIFVVDSNISYINSETVVVNVDFSSANLGKYNVVLKDSLGNEIIINDGFELQENLPPNLKINIIGPSYTRQSLPTRYWLKVTNNSNCPSIAAPIMLFVSGNNKVNFKDSIYDFYGNKRDTMLYTEVENYFGDEGISKGYIFLIDQIPANGSVFYPIDITALLPHEKCEINASIGNPFIDNLIKLEKTRGRFINVTESTFNCVTGLAEYIASSLVKDNLNCSYGMHKLLFFGGHLKGFDFGQTVAEAVTSCTNALLGYTPSYKALKIGLMIFGAGMSGYEGGQVINSCKCLIDNFCRRDKKDFTGIISNDPNDKFGIGFGDAHWIHNTETLSYGIHFENVDTASASAQVVILRDTLDMSKVDITTFKPELITIGNQTIDFATNKTNQPLLYDMRPTINLIVKIEIMLDSVSGEVKVVYTSLDPSTMLLTTDPLLGFLPPNINKPNGEGSFYYSIKLKPNLPSNTIINNTANIYFDTNDPILTPTWSNAIDILPPTSRMNTINPNTNDTTIYLSWSGTDAHSGIQKYDVMYSENGGAFKSYVTNFSNDSIRFYGKVGSSYSFYTIAIDNVGNRESKTNGEVSAKINEQDVQIFPNPSNGEFTIQTKNDTQFSSISLFNLQGQKIPITFKKMNNTYKVHAPLQQHLGNYILKIITKDKTISCKITIEK